MALNGAAKAAAAAVAVATTTCAQVHFVVEAIQVIHSGVYIDQFDLFVCKGYSFDANLVARASKH